MSTGWNFNFNQKKYTEKKKKKKLKYIKLFNKKSVKNSKNKNELLVRKSLNCGPAGRNALIRWIEYNYKLKSDEENRYPAANACKVWQKTQSFQDIVLSGLVDFLKFLNVPKHITYKSVFDNYLSPKFINKVNLIDKSQKCLIKLAKKMILMFQVREIQPLFSLLLEKIDIIPLCILNILVEKTPAAKYFYDITSIKVKRKIWTLCPEKFFEEVEPIIEEIIFRMKIKNNSETINNLIYKIIELIGEEKEKIFLYNLCVHIIRLKSLETILNAKEIISHNMHPNAKCNNQYTKDNSDNISSTKINENNTRNESKGYNETNKENKCNEVNVNKEVDENSFEKVNSNSPLEPNDFEIRLKKLQICFDKIMNKRENLKNEEVNYKDEFKLYYIALQEYNYNSTSFEFLKKRKNIEKYDIYKMKKGETKLSNDEKKEGNSFIKSNNNYYEEKYNFKRSLIVNQEEKKTKKIKINLNNSKGEDTLENISVKSEKHIYEGNDKILFEKIRNNNNNNKNSNNSSNSNRNSNRESDNNKIKENMDESKESYIEKNKYKINMNEYCKSKTLLPFDNMFYSNLRLLLCLQYKEKYNINDEEMIIIDKYFYIIEFINNIIKDGILSFGDEIKIQEIINKTQKSLKIKNIDDLYEYSLLFNNILLKFAIIEGICFYFYKNNFNILTLKNNIKFWISLFYFGIYNNFFSLIKYAVDKIECQERKKKLAKTDKHKNGFYYEDELKLWEYAKHKNNSFNEQIEELKDKKEDKNENKNEYVYKENDERSEEDDEENEEDDEENEKDDERSEEDDKRSEEDDERSEEDDEENEEDDEENEENDEENEENDEENEENYERSEENDERSEENDEISEGYSEENEYEWNIYEDREGKVYEKEERKEVNQEQTCLRQHKSEKKEEQMKKKHKTYKEQNKKKFSNFKLFTLNKINKNVPLKNEKRKKIEPNLKMETDSIRDSNKSKREFGDNICMKGEIKNNNLKLFFNVCKESYLKIPLMNILNYIILPNNMENNFFSFFDYFDEGNNEKLKNVKEKNSILLLSTLLNIPQLDYIKIKNFFSIIDEFFYLEKKNFTIIESYNNIRCDSSAHQSINGAKITKENKINLKNESFKNSRKYNNIKMEIGDLTNTTNFNMNKKDVIKEMYNYYKKNNEHIIDLDKEKKLNDSNAIYNNLDGDIHVLKEKNTYDQIGKKLINCINDMNNTISDNQFLINNNINSIYMYLKDEVNINHSMNSVNAPLKCKFNTSEKNTIKNKTYSINYFYEISNKLLEKLNYEGKIKKYSPYIFKICFIFLNFFKKKKLINIYIKYLHLYGYFYHMILNRVLFISTMKSIPVLQNIILKELHFYFEDFKNMNEKNLWKFFLYAHTLIDINQTKSNSLNKLFHNNAIDYFLKLYYYLSFYNPTFSTIFLKIIETPLFFKHIENKKTEILQNLWIGTHERSFFYFSKNKRYSIEYKIWIDSYNKISER